MDINQLCRTFLQEQGCGDLNWRILLTAKEIQRGVDKLANEINAIYKPPQAKPLVLVGLLKGCFVFLADLSRKLKIPHTIYFLEVSSYAGQQQGQVKFASEVVPSKLCGRQILLLDELFDHGETMHRTKQALLDNPELKLMPEDIRTCTLFIKDSGTKLAPPDLVGLPMLPALWLVGFGLDADGEKRGWPHLFACPKADGVPTCAEDAIFDDDAEYSALRKRVEQSIRPAIVPIKRLELHIANGGTEDEIFDQLASQ